MRIHNWSSVLLAALALSLVAGPAAFAQSSTTGLITGMVTDPSGAVVAHTEVTLRSADSGSTRRVSTDSNGRYQIAYTAPGDYTLSVAAAGFAEIRQPVTVTVGQTVTADFHLRLDAAATSVQVEGGLEGVQTENAQVSTSYTHRQIESLPNPGQDITSIVQLAPGAVMNTGGTAGGHMTFYGLPATANMFQLNGMDDTAYFSNVNASGATNLTLGTNEIETATVITNAYSGQYGRLAGAQIDYVTRSGSNQFHGNAAYFWNGRALNGNDFFNNAHNVPRPFSNANQWATSLGGPVIKNRTFFFFDFEGLRVILPSVTSVNIPSPAFEQATIANLQKVSPASVPFYQQLFGIYNAAPGAARATPLAGSCGTFTTLGAGVPCALQFGAATDNLTTEWQIGWRIDQQLSAADHLFVRFQTDHGTQAQTTSPFSPIFNSYSPQPEWQGQLNETHTFGGTMVNEFLSSFRWISALFGPRDVSATLAALPFSVAFTGSAFTTVGYTNQAHQGRREALVQVGDNFTWVRGAHTLRGGVMLRRDNISSFAQAVNTAGTATVSLASFYAGQVSTFSQAFTTTLDRPLALYSLGGYAEDDWHATNNLTFTLSLRLDHNSNPICRTDCFGRLISPFEALTHSLDTPYNQALTANAHQAFFDGTGLTLEPRFGFAWTPLGKKTTVIRGGFGLFNSGLPGSVSQNFITNSPAENTFTVTGALSPAATGSATSAAAADNAAFAAGYPNGATLAQLQKSVQGFTAPNFYTSAGAMHDAIYREWNFEIQHAIGSKMMVSANYVGNSGYHEPFVVSSVNGYCPPAACPAGFSGLPAAAPDARFGTITELATSGVSNYNGVTLSFNRRVSGGLLLTANYTYGHALDMISNGGITAFDNVTNSSILAALNPANWRSNYGNADYDVRHSLVLGYVWNTPRIARSRVLSAIARDWSLAGNVFTRSGLPFSVISSAQAATEAKYGAKTTVLANYLGGAQPGCSVSVTCLVAGDFSVPTASPGQQERNQFRGVTFFDLDLSLTRQFSITEHVHFIFGIQSFNILNHANFATPTGDINNAQFGRIVSTIGIPTSVMGANLGGDSSRA